MLEWRLPLAGAAGGWRECESHKTSVDARRAQSAPGERASMWSGGPLTAAGINIGNNVRDCKLLPAPNCRSQDPAPHTERLPRTALAFSP